MTDDSWHTFTTEVDADGTVLRYVDGEAVDGVWPQLWRDEDGQVVPDPTDPFPRTNRETRRHCDHQYKTIGPRTACVRCGASRG